MLRVSPGGPSPNLDLEAVLIDSSGVVVTASDPAGVATAVIDADLLAGTYFVKVRGVGSGDAASGYSDYGSLGYYRVSGTFTNAVPATPGPTTTSTTTTTTTTTTTSTAVNEPPVAAAFATPNIVVAGNSVMFDGGGSYDPDGRIISWTWSLPGASPAISNSARTSAVYTAPGSYIAELTVVDDQGRSAATTVRVEVEPAASTAKVASVSIRRGSSTSTVVADVVVVDQTGAPVAGAVVVGSWSGQAKGTVSVTTDRAGRATTPETRMRRSGKVTFAIDSVTAPTGYTWDGVRATTSVKL
jgi:hypothetical protein